MPLLASRTARRILLGSLAALALALGATLLLRLPRTQALLLGRAARFDVDFTRSDAWKAFGGSWDASTGEIESRSEERGAKLISQLGPWQDLEVQADMRLAESDGEAGILLRTNNEEEGVHSYAGYFAGIRAIDGAMELGRSDFGWRSLARGRLPAHADPTGWVHLRVAAVGCELLFEATLPGGQASALHATDPDCLRKGSFGLRSSLTGARWKNLRLTVATPANLQTHAVAQSGPPPPLSIDSTLLSDPATYIASFAAEARKHAVLPGVQPIGTFALRPGLHPGVLLQGTIISTPPLTALQDDSSAMIIPYVDPSLRLKRGDVVLAQGDVVTTRFRSELDNAHLRVLWSDTPIPPLAVTAPELSSGVYRGRTISIEGILVSVNVRAADYELVLRDGDFLFRAIGPLGFARNPAALQPGSRLRLLGFATSMERFTDNIYPFTVIIDRVDVLADPPWWSLRHILMLAFVLILLLLAAQLGLHRLQRWHTNSLLHEREQLAFEMHDTLAQDFTGIAYQLQAASMEKRGESYIRAHVNTALQLVQMSHKEASRTIAALRPQYRDAAAILAALHDYGHRLSDGGDLKIGTQLTGRNTRLPLRVTDALFRIGQEAISNAVQHSGCKQIAVELELHRRDVDFRVHDDGHGFASEMIGDGLGIVGMRNRAAKIKASFEIVTAPDGGTTICVHASGPVSLSLLSFFSRARVSRQD
jgi:signal transduction histidine kinase